MPNAKYEKKEKRIKAWKAWNKRHIPPTKNIIRLKGTV